MSLGTDYPCPHTGEWCQHASCPATACLYDLDEAVWPDTEMFGSDESNGTEQTGAS